MTKEFAPYDRALKLNQLGFDERCFKYEDVKKICENHEQPGGCQLPNVHCGYPNCTIDRSIEPLGIPIWQQAFRWFREEYNQHSFIELVFEDEIRFDYVLYVNEDEDDCIDYGDGPFETYEDAELALLDKLIEIAEGIKSQK